jgi:hypothetical protein
MRRGKKAKLARQMSAELREICRSSLAPQEQLARLDRRPGNSTRERARLNG